MTIHGIRILPALLALLVALTAFAGGVELEPAAAALVADYQALESRIDACPGGDCEDRKAIEADLVSLDFDLAELEAERAALGSCTDCEALDALLDEAAWLSATASETSGDWEDLD